MFLQETEVSTKGGKTVSAAPDWWFRLPCHQPDPAVLATDTAKTVNIIQNDVQKFTASDVNRGNRR